MLLFSFFSYRCLFRSFISFLFPPLLIKKLFNVKSYSSFFFFFYLRVCADIGIWQDFSKETDLYRIGNLGTESF